MNPIEVTQQEWSLIREYLDIMINTPIIAYNVSEFFKEDHAFITGHTGDLRKINLIYGCKNDVMSSMMFD